MKHLTSFRFASASILVLLASLLFTVNALAAVDAFIWFQGTSGEGTYKGKVDPATGDCVIKDMPAGTYHVSLVASPEFFTTTNAGGVPSGTIEISSFSWGVTNPSSLGGGSGGAGAGKSKFNEITIKKTTDKASPELASTTAAGSGGGSGGGAGKASMSDISATTKSDKSSPKLADAVTTAPSSGGFTHKTCPLSVRKAGTEQKDFYVVTLQDIFVSSVSSPSSGDVSVAKGKGGTGDSAIKTTYDVKMCVKG